MEHHIATQKLIDLRPHGWDVEAFCNCGHPLHAWGDTPDEAKAMVRSNFAEHIEILAYDRQFNGPVIDSYERYRAEGGHLDHSSWYSMTNALLQTMTDAAMWQEEEAATSLEESPMWPRICQLRETLGVEYAE